MMLLRKNIIDVSEVLLIVLSLNFVQCLNILATNSCALSSDNVSHCPAWFKPIKDDDSTCQCGNAIDNLIQCDSDTKVYREFCVTFDAASHTVYGGKCPYNNWRDNSNASLQLEVTLPPNVYQLQTMCDHFNRTGLLCSQCKPGLGPAVLFSRRCVECFDSGYGWLVYITAALGPTTIFCILIIICRINANTPTLRLVIMFCQLIVNLYYMSKSLLYSVQNPVERLIIGLLSFYGLWNLDFFHSLIPPFCISSKMNMLQVVALDYLVALYPLVVTAVVYYCIEWHDKGCKVLVTLWKPFHPCFVRVRRGLNIKGPVVNVFATFMVLSYCKIFFISNGLLRPITLYNGCGDKTNVVYYEPSTLFLSKSHLPYAIIAIVFLALFNLLPLVYILFYQNKFFQRCIVKCKINVNLFSELARVCHIHYKDGIDGTPDCRWYSGIYFVYQITYLMIFYYIGPHFLQACISIVLLSGVVMVVCAFLKPYKKFVFNLFDTTYFGLNTFMILYFTYIYANTTINPTYSSTVTSIFPILVIGTLPLFYFICLIIFKLLRVTTSQNCTQALLQTVKNKIISICNENPQDRCDIVPDRLLHSSEYQPLLPPVGAT